MIPLKATTRGKSRLGLPDVPRAALALAMARDTIAAVLDAGPVSSVVVVTEDRHDAAALVADGVQVVVTDVRGLNESLLAAAGWLAAAGRPGPVAVLPGDLPFLTSDDLSAALSAAGGSAGVVADADGTGTTLLVAPSAAQLRPLFGIGSYRRHLDDGAVALVVAGDSSLHRDVDVLADLLESLPGAAPGTHTRDVLEALSVVLG